MGELPEPMPMTYLLENATCLIDIFTFCCILHAKKCIKNFDYLRDVESKVENIFGVFFISKLFQ